MSFAGSPLPFSVVKSLEDFVRKRWVRVGKGGFDGLADAAEMSKQTIYSVTRSPNPARAGRLETREKLAMTLQFRDWNDLMDAFALDDVGHGLPDKSDGGERAGGIHLESQTVAVARREADRRGMTLEEWLTTLVYEAAAQGARGRLK